MIKGFRSADLQEKAEIISQNIAKFSKNKEIKDIARELSNPTDIVDWVSNKIKYKKEEKDTLYGPLEAIERGQGDCEELTVLVGTLMKAKNYPVAVRIISNSSNHVFPLILVRSRWADADSAPRGLSRRQINERYRVVTQGMVGPTGALKGLPKGKVDRDLGATEDDKDNQEPWYDRIIDNIPVGLGIGLGTVFSNYIWGKYLKDRFNRLL